jgi:hypothetical protein
MYVSERTGRLIGLLLTAQDATNSDRNEVPNPAPTIANPRSGVVTDGGCTRGTMQKGRPP